MATHSSIFAWEIPWPEEPGGATVHGMAKPDTTERLALSHSLPFFSLTPPPICL